MSRCTCGHNFKKGKKSVKLSNVCKQGFSSIASTAVAAFLLSAAMFAQQPAAPASNSTAPAAGTTTVRGCLRGQRGNYILIENKTGSVYVLKGVGNKLEADRRHEVEVTGKVLGGTVKTGVTPEKVGSNPADTVHGVDGVPLQVNNVDTDVRVTADKCKPTSEQQ